MSIASKSPLNRLSALLIRTLVWFGPLTRSKLGERTGLTRGQTNRLLEDLHARGWIVFGDELHSPVGRPAARIMLSPSLGYFLSVTLEDNQGRITLATSDMECLASKMFEYNFATGPTMLLAALERQIRLLLAENQISPRKLLTTAVSVPGPVETREHSVFRPHPSPGWQGFDIAAYLDGALRRPAFIDNDANMATVGELKFWRTNDQSAGGENWLVVKMNDSGIGAGIVSNGLVHRGATGLAGEIAHIQVERNGPRCGCGLRGCLTSLASAPVLLDRARMKLNTGIGDRLPGEDMAAETSFSLQDLGVAAQSGDELANSLLLEAGNRIGNVVAGVVSTLNPRKVLVGGRFARMGPLILSSIRQSIYGGSLPLATHTIDVEYMRNPNAETTGTLVYAFERLLDSQCQANSTTPVLSPLC
jgi:predicted NBD/HSP70 family sugar kinase